MHKTFEANGLTFAYRETGPKDGPLVLCAHGFPDTADTWFHHIAPALAKDGYRVVAPWMRGYHPTQIPSDHDFGGVALGRDLVAWIEALGAERAVLVGHDWGAQAVYCALGTDSSRIRAAFTFDIPHPNAIKPSLGLLWGVRHFILFQFRNRAVGWVSRNNFANIDALYKRWSPTWSFTPEDTQPVKDSFAHTGVPAAALGYYWSFRDDQRGQRATDLQAILRKPITVPLMSFAGTEGPTSTHAAFKRAEKFCQNDYQMVIVPDAGHWIHRENPQCALENIRTFLQKHP